VNERARARAQDTIRRHLTRFGHVPHLCDFKICREWNPHYFEICRAIQEVGNGMGWNPHYWCEKCQKVFWFNSERDAQDDKALYWAASFESPEQFVRLRETIAQVTIWTKYFRQKHSSVISCNDIIIRDIVE
jgi:hypothetical protein